MALEVSVGTTVIADLVVEVTSEGMIERDIAVFYGNYDQNVIVGGTVQTGVSLISGSNTISINFDAEHEGTFDVWAVVGVYDEASEQFTSVDDTRALKGALVVKPSAPPVSIRITGLTIHT